MDRIASAKGFFKLGVLGFEALQPLGVADVQLGYARRQMPFTAEVQLTPKKSR